VSIRKWLHGGLERVGGGRRVLPWLWLVAAAACLALSAWLLDRVWHVGEPSSRRAWSQAADRIASRIGPGEVVFVHTAGRSAQAADALQGLPVACDPWEGTIRLDKPLPAGIWVAGDRSLSGRLRDLLDGLSRQGTIGFGTVHLRHHWQRADTNKPPKKRR